MTPGSVEDLETLWGEVAERIGGELSTRGGMPVLQLRRHDWILTLDRFVSGSQSMTRLRAPFWNPRQVRLRIRREGVMDDLWKKLGFVQEVESDDRRFDHLFLVKGTPRRVVRELLARDRVRDLLMRQLRVDLRVLDRAFDTRFPPGVDQLLFREGGVGPLGADRLVALFELFLEILPVLDPPGAGVGEEPTRSIERLRGPSGVVRTWGGTVLWDGDAPRSAAAERLAGHVGDDGHQGAREALMEALGDRSARVVAAAAAALGEAGEHAGVPRLVELLGERRRSTGSDTVADHAARALRSLGRGPVADAFEDALAGEPDGLLDLRGAERDAMVRALMEVLDSAEFGARSGAARALGSLGAAEALPLLRRRSVAMGMRTSLTEAARAAIAAIEERASLPRPAGRPVAGRETLPRPAVPGGDPGGGSLPRPARDPEEPGRGQGDVRRGDPRGPAGGS